MFLLNKDTFRKAIMQIDLKYTTCCIKTDYLVYLPLDIQYHIMNSFYDPLN